MLRTPVNFYYYSGTGNTLLIVNEMKKVFLENGIQINCYPMEQVNPAKIDLGEVIGLAFPVAFQSTFPFVWEFLHNLPQANGTPVFMVDTMMAFSGAIVGPLKKVLTKKGYHCIGASEIVMPNNFLPKTIDVQKNNEKIKKGLEKAGKYAENLILGKTKWNRIPFLSSGFYHLCCNDYVMKKICLADGKKITLNKEKCMKCGLCSRLCPVKNIEFEDYPKWSNKCQLCMRCLTFCPAGAISIPNKKFERYRAVRAGVLQKPSNDKNND